MCIRDRAIIGCITNTQESADIRTLEVRIAMAIMIIMTSMAMIIVTSVTVVVVAGVIVIVFVVGTGFEPINMFAVC